MVGISVPMHTAARLGVAFARRVRALNPRAHIAFYGLYAWPLRERLHEEGLADSVAGGEYEPRLCELAAAVASSNSPASEGQLALAFPRQRYPVPDRSGLPGLDRYARLVHGSREVPAGYVEASRGCAHTCTHCPITPIYGGRLRLVQPEVVLADIDQQVAAGAGHITFGDPDFFNARPHSLAIAEEFHRRHPDLTFDATIKVEHLVEHADALPRLRELGCLFVTSAFESLNPKILGMLEKGHTPDDIERALDLAEDAGLFLRPTWMAFTPWTSLDDIVETLDFVERRGLVRHVQPVQYALRLLLPPGSPLIEIAAAQGLLDGFDADGLTYTWHNPDPRVDALQAQLADLTAAAASTHEEHPVPAEETFAAVRQLVGPMPSAAPNKAASVAPRPQRPVPGLTEAWFC